MKKVKLVVDTNVLLVSLSPKNKYGCFYQLFRLNKVELLLSNEILNEYIEICSSRYPKQIIEELFDALLLFRNVHLITPSFHWNLIQNDPDDNKFVDCAVVGGADYIVSNDTHFNVLQNITFPKISVLTLAQFEQLFKDQLLT